MTRGASQAGQTTTEYMMILGLITTVFMVVQGTTERPFRAMMRDLLQCIADGTTNQQRCDQVTSTGVRAGNVAPTPQALLQSGVPLSTITQQLQERFETLQPSRPGPPAGGGSAGSGSGSSESVAPGAMSGSGGGSAAVAPVANSIRRATGTPVASHHYQTEEGASGAYYRKVESDADAKNTGVSGVVTLPKFKADPNRINTDERLGKTGPMDRPSVYMGAHTETKIGGVPVSAEADIGLQYTQRYDAQGRETFVPASVQEAGTRPTDEQLYYRGEDGAYYNQKGEKFEGDPNTLVTHYTYTPFARLNEPVLDANGKPVMEKDPVTGRNKVKYDNRYVELSKKEDQDRYFYPGERVEMSVERKVGGSPNVAFSVQRDGEAKQQYGIQSVLLGRGDVEVSTKKVTSIDQYVWENGKVVSAESRTPPRVDPTNARLSGAIWERTSVLQNGGQTPMTGPTFTQVVPKDPGNQVDEGNTFHIGNQTSLGGERIDISPTAPRGRR